MSNIAIDVDDVLFPLNPGFIKHHNRVYGTNLTTFGMYNVFEVLGCTKEESVRRYHEYYQTEDFNSTIPIEGSQNAVEILTKQNRLHIITARPEFMKDPTIEWLNCYFEGMFKQEDIHFTNQCNFFEVKKRKVDICLEQRIELLIDDCLSYILECQREGVNALLFGNYGWNQFNGEQGIVRVNNWREVLEKIEKQ